MSTVPDVKNLKEHQPKIAVVKTRGHFLLFLIPSVLFALPKLMKGTTVSLIRVPIHFATSASWNGTNLLNKSELNFGLNM